MAVSRRLKVAGAIVGSFLALLGLIWTLAFHGVLSPQEAGLMAVALFGMYVGFGILIGVHRLISKLD
jgi:uncharacterized membrane protein (DUF485 family)